MEVFIYLIIGQIINLGIFILLFKYIKSRKKESNTSYSVFIDNIVGFLLYILLFILSFVFWYFIILEAGLDYLDNILLIMSGAILLIIFVIYVILSSRNNNFIIINKEKSNNEEIEVINIISDYEFPFKINSVINTKLLNDFKYSENNILISELGILNLFFTRLTFKEFFDKINYRYDNKLLDFITKYYIEEFFSLSKGDDSINKINDRLDYYSNDLKYGMGVIGIGYNILEVLTGENMSFGNMSSDISKIENYIYTQLEISNMLSSSLVKRNKSTNIFNEKKEVNPLQEEVLNTAKNILEEASSKYNSEEEELTNYLFNIFKKSLNKTSIEKLEKKFGKNINEKKINNILYNNFIEIIVKHFEIESIHSPLSKFEYYSFLLFYFLEKLKYNGELTEDEVNSFIRSLQIDGGGGYINMSHERDKYLEEYYNLNKLSEKEYRKHLENNIKNGLKEALELDEDKKDSLLSDIYRLVSNGEYKKVINFDNIDYLPKYLIETNNIKELSEYYLLVGASYQETGNLKLADKCFDIFLDNISIDSNTIKAFEKLGVEDIGVIKMMLLVKELQDIGLDYKMEKEVYEKASKLDDKNKKRKHKK